jgi:hypothetical protein
MFRLRNLGIWIRRRHLAFYLSAFLRAEWTASPAIVHAVVLYVLELFRVRQALQTPI